MPPGMSDDEYIAALTRRAAESDIQELVASWPPFTPEQLALTARVFGGSRRARGVRGEAA